MSMAEAQLYIRHTELDDLCFKHQVEEAPNLRESADNLLAVVR